MKRLHVHLKVQDLQESISFYNALFGEQPSVTKTDYAKWMLEDPQVNFAISSGASTVGIEHLGIETSEPTELDTVYARMQTARGQRTEVKETVCCYAKSKKAWINDPQNVAWEAFYTHGSSTIYGDGSDVRPAPTDMSNWETSEAQPMEKAAPKRCC